MLADAPRVEPRHGRRRVGRVGRRPLEQRAEERRVRAQAGARAGHLLLGEAAIGPLAPPLDQPRVVAHDLGEPLPQQRAMAQQAAVAPARLAGSVLAVPLALALRRLGEQLDAALGHARLKATHEGGKGLLRLRHAEQRLAAHLEPAHLGARW